jgi:shikimate kinase
MSYSFKPSLSFRSPKTIVLVGMMGAGKTSIGRRLAKRLDLEFFDSDQEVEKAAGCSINQIIEFYGEDSFRQGEQRVINRLLDQSPHVLATGGGAFAHPETRALIKNKAISVWLNADIETLVARVSRRTDRPLINNEDPRDDLETMFKNLAQVYSEADVSVATFEEATGTTVERVVQCLTDFIREIYPQDYVLKAAFSESHDK